MARILMVPGAEMDGRILGATLLVCLTLTGCDDHAGATDLELCADALQRRMSYPLRIASEIDILLVVDTSPAMQDKTDALARSLPGFVEALRWPPLDDKLMDARIGVVSADLGTGEHAVPGCSAAGDGGVLQRAPRVPGCTPPSDPWISHDQGKTNIPAGPADPVEQVKQALSCIGQLGSSGCRFAQPLEAARRALDPALNPGFLREHASLMVLIVTAGDDCSAARTALFDPDDTTLDGPLGPLTPFRCFELGVSCDINDRTQPGPRRACVPAHDWLVPVESYVEFFKSLKPPKRVMVVVVSGPTDRVEVQLDEGNPVLAPSCDGASGHGTPAIRLEALARAFGMSGRFNKGMIGTHGFPLTICADNYGPAVWLSYLPVGRGPGCLPWWPVTRDCALACSQGAPLADGSDAPTCASSCLERADCVVYQHVQPAGDETRQTTVIPRCADALFRNPAARDCGATCPCWRLVTEAQCKPSLHGSPYVLQILRQDDEAAPRGAVAELRCEASVHYHGSPELLALPRCD